MAVPDLPNTFKELLGKSESSASQWKESTLTSLASTARTCLKEKAGIRTPADLEAATDDQLMAVVRQCTDDSTSLRALAAVFRAAGRTLLADRVPKPRKGRKPKSISTSHRVEEDGGADSEDLSVAAAEEDACSDEEDAAAVGGAAGGGKETSEADGGDTPGPGRRVLHTLVEAVVGEEVVSFRVVASDGTSAAPVGDDSPMGEEEFVEALDRAASGGMSAKRGEEIARTYAAEGGRTRITGRYDTEAEAAFAMARRVDAEFAKLGRKFFVFGRHCENEPHSVHVGTLPTSIKVWDPHARAEVEARSPEVDVFRMCVEEAIRSSREDVTNAAVRYRAHIATSLVSAALGLAPKGMESDEARQAKRVFWDTILLLADAVRSKADADLCFLPPKDQGPCTAAIREIASVRAKCKRLEERLRDALADAESSRRDAMQAREEVRAVREEQVRTLTAALIGDRRQHPM